MGYDRYSRGDDRQRDAYGYQDTHGRDHNDGYRARDYGHRRYGQREQMNRGIDYAHGGDPYGGDRGYARGGGSSEGRDRYGAGERGDDDRGYRQGGYGERHPNDRGYSQRAPETPGNGRYDEARAYGIESDRSPGRDYDHGRERGRAPEGYQYEDRGFLARAGDEVRSWFGDDEAERRRDQDARLDERYDNDRDADYGSWRRGQINALDRDYHEYRQENRSRFESEFAAWRTNRQGQRDSLGRVKEHMDVVGADGSHVGTVDKVRGDRIVLTKSDRDADGHHHSIPSSWIAQVDDAVTLSKSADEAKRAWRDEEVRSGRGDDRAYRSSSSYGAGTGGSASAAGMASASSSATSAAATDADGRTDLNKSFPGTY